MFFRHWPLAGDAVFVCDFWRPFVESHRVVPGVIEWLSFSVIALIQLTLYIGFDGSYILYVLLYFFNIFTFYYHIAESLTSQLTKKPVGKCFSLY